MSIVEPEGFEPSTFYVQGRRSTELSYNPIIKAPKPFKQCLTPYQHGVLLQHLLNPVGLPYFQDVKHF